MVNFEQINKLFKRKDKVLPKKRQVFAVGTGTYVGEMLVYVKTDTDNHYFLSIPKNINRIVPIDKFNFALENKILEFAADLPKNVYQMCSKQFFYNEKVKNLKKD